MKSEDTATGLKRVEGFLGFGDGVGGSGGGFTDALGPVTRFSSLPDKFHKTN